MTYSQQGLDEGLQPRQTPIALPHLEVKTRRSMVDTEGWAHMVVPLLLEPLYIHPSTKHLQ